MLHQIGVGALGPVFRTYEPTRDRLVAVKVFRLDITPEQARALADELGRAADARLFHPSIVEPVAAGVEGTVAYRAEEYVAAESLDVAMRHHAPATLDKVLPFIAQLAAAIDFARAAGVGHGALHPRDIFVSPDEARATGFGVVDALDRLEMRAPVRRPYSPPERIAGQAWGTPADVFSLAVIAFELLTARRPSGLGTEMGSLSGAVLGSNTDAVRDVLVRAMHENPDERYATAEAFAADLQRAAGHEAAAAPVVEPDLPMRPAAEPERAPFDVLIHDAAPAAPDVFADVPASEPTPAEPVSPAIAFGLDDFAVESSLPSPTDSPREMARRVIAARKRQARSKPPVETELPLPAEIPSSAEADGSTDEPITARDEPESSPVVPPPPIPETPIEAPAPTVSLEAEPVSEPPVEPEPPFAPVYAQMDRVDPLEEPPSRAVSDRVVAVDEFRARDAAAKPERSWPRAPERTFSERVTLPVPSPIQSVEADIPLLPVETTPTERTRIVMLPVAVGIILGLLLGYAAGYIVGSREQRASIAARTDSTTTPAPPLQTPGTSGQTAGKEFSEQAVTPAARPAPTPPAVSRDAARAAATPAPSAAARDTRAPRTGRLVVNSTPSRAAVTVNDKWRGRTPLTLDDLAFGTYVVRIVEPGYEVAREEVTLSSANAARTIAAKLRASASTQRSAGTAAAATPKSSTPAVGEIYIDSRPRGARVVIDGKEHGTTPLRVTGQTVGAHTIRLELDDHAPWTYTTKVVARRTARVTGSLERIRQDR